MGKIYHLDLDQREAVSIRSLLKDEVKRETASIELLNKQLESQPAMQAIIDYSKEQRSIYLKAYEMMGRPQDEQK